MNMIPFIVGCLCGAIGLLLIEVIAIAWTVCRCGHLEPREWGDD